MRLGASHADWVLGFEDETWWSRVAQPALHAWAAAEQPLRLIEPTVSADDPDRKALACYGLLLRGLAADSPSPDTIWLRFVEARPVSAMTIRFLEWACLKLEAAGKRALLLVWDNASWHLSQAVRLWLRNRNRQVKRDGHGVRLIVCPLPTKSPWLNPIEPHWMHGKRRVVEPDRLLTADELMGRVYDTFGCAHESPLAIPEKVV